MTQSSLAAESKGKSLFVCVGDVSADKHAARVLARLKELAPELHIWGVGGPQMKSLGVDIMLDCSKFAVIGLIEVLRHVPKLLRLKWDLIDAVGKRRPDAILLVDFGGFNLGLAQPVHKKYPDIPIVYFISPQVWGSRPWRIEVIKKTVAKMLVLFPFEETYYRQRGVEATFVGHPLTLTVPQPQERPSKQEFCSRHGLDPNRPIIGIFPGSRRQEITELGPVVLEAVSWLWRKRPELQFVVSRANEARTQDLDKLLDRKGYRHLVGTAVTLLPPGENHELMQAADILWTKSGTTTLEAALFGKPMLIYYRGNWLTYGFVLSFKRVRHYGWPNLLAGKMVVPELIQLDCRAEQFVRYTEDWLDVPAVREEISRQVEAVRQRLGHGDFATAAADELMKVLKLNAGAQSSQTVGTG